MDRLNKFYLSLQEHLPDFTTTIGQTIYFPNRERVEDSEMQYIAILAHEYVHASDARDITSVLFGFLYLLPLTLSPFMLLFLLIHWGLAMILFLLCLAPMPAYFRKHYELRGYTMSLFMRNEIMKENNVSKEARRAALEQVSERYNAQFTGPNYYFMWPFGVEEDLAERIDLVMSGDILREDPVFMEVQEAFTKSKN